jgi:hypothetical protein
LTCAPKPNPYVNGPNNQPTDRSMKKEKGGVKLRTKKPEDT